MSRDGRNIRILFVYYQLSSFVRCDLEELTRPWKIAWMVRNQRQRGSYKLL